MEKLDFYSTLIANSTSTNQKKIAYIEEEIDILIHKLKFISAEARPSTLVLNQANSYEPLFSSQIIDTIAIGGGKLLADKFDNPNRLIFIQHNEDLYAEIISVLEDDVISRTDAVKQNEIYIINKTDFGTEEEGFLSDVEIAAEILQPKYFVYGRQGNDWVRFDLLS